MAQPKSNSIRSNGRVAREEKRITKPLDSPPSPAKKSPLLRLSLWGNSSQHNATSNSISDEDSLAFSEDSRSPSTKHNEQYANNSNNKLTVNQSSQLKPQTKKSKGIKGIFQAVFSLGKSSHKKESTTPTVDKTSTPTKTERSATQRTRCNSSDDEFSMKQQLSHSGSVDSPRSTDRKESQVYYSRNEQSEDTDTSGNSSIIGKPPSGRSPPCLNSSRSDKNASNEKEREFANVSGRPPRCPSHSPSPSVSPQPAVEPQPLRGILKNSRPIGRTSSFTSTDGSVSDRCLSWHDSDKDEKPPRPPVRAAPGIASPEPAPSLDNVSVASMSSVTLKPHSALYRHTPPSSFYGKTCGGVSPTMDSSLSVTRSVCTASPSYNARDMYATTPPTYTPPPQSSVYAYAQRVQDSESISSQQSLSYSVYSHASSHAVAHTRPLIVSHGAPYRSPSPASSVVSSHIGFYADNPVSVSPLPALTHSPYAPHAPHTLPHTQSFPTYRAAPAGSPALPHSQSLYAPSQTAQTGELDTEEIAFQIAVQQSLQHPQPHRSATQEVIARQVDELNRKSMVQAIVLSQGTATANPAPLSPSNASSSRRVSASLRGRVDFYDVHRRSTADIESGHTLRRAGSNDAHDLQMVKSHTY